MDGLRIKMLEVLPILGLDKRHLSVGELASHGKKYSNLSVSFGIVESAIAMVRR